MTAAKRAISPEQKEARRGDLLDAALDAFFERGFSAARIEEIAARAGVSKGVVYLYFGSKQEILEALVERHASPNLDLLDQLVETIDPGEALDRFPAFGERLVRETPMPKLAKVLISESVQFPEIARLYHERVAGRAIAKVTRLIERGCETGVFKTVDPEIIGRLVVAPMIFSAIWSVVFEPIGNDKINVRKTLQTSVDMIRNYLCVKPGGAV